MNDTGVTVAPPRYGLSLVEKPWIGNPWRALRDREHITFAFDPVAAFLGGGLYAKQGDRSVIMIDPALSRRQRAAVLAHELVHDERVVDATAAMPPSWDAVRTRLHIAVDDEAVVRLLPLVLLEAFCRRHVEAMGVVTLHDVAEEFDCAEWVAKRALELLIERLAA